jgi:carbonic anhydrase
MTQTRQEPSATGSLQTAATNRLRTYVQHDLLASLVVFLVAVPLSLGIALASGAPIEAGLIAAVVGGIVAGALGGSQLQVSGPAAGMVVVVAGFITDYGWATVCAITAAAGLMQMALGATGAARLALAISPAVVHGMLAGIGISIVLGQLHVILGFKSHSHPLENIQALPADLAAEHPAATAIGLGTIAILLAWPKLPAKVRAVPGPLAAIFTMTLISMVFSLPVAHPDVPANLLDISFAPSFSGISAGGFVAAAATVALLASVESLLSAVAVDKMHNGPRAKLSRELFGQGAGNTVSGAIGGLPITGVIVRSSTNVLAGAKTRASAVSHGVWVLLFAAALGGLIENIPLAALAGLLVHVGIKLVNISHMKELSRHGDLWVYAATLSGVVLLDLIKGVAIGLTVAFILLMRRMLWSNVHSEKTPDGHVVTLEGMLSFVSTHRLASVLNAIPAKEPVRLEVQVDYMDHSAISTITDWVKSHRSTGGSVVIDEAGHPWLSEGQAGEPLVSRRTAQDRAVVPRWLAPWKYWQATETDATQSSDDEGLGGNEALRRGVERYRRHSPLFQPMLESLSDDQSPSTLFITCCDSRVVPNIITASGPGDLFVVRNIGNFVPPYPEPDDATTETSVAAAIEYAVGVLDVNDIVVCGHSGCGAMKALVEGAPSEGQFDALRRWLAYAGQTLAAQAESGRRLDPNKRFHRDRADIDLDELAKQNVMVQLEQLRTYPMVAEAQQDGLQLVGMYFDIPTADVYLLPEHKAQQVDPLRVPSSAKVT